MDQLFAQLAIMLVVATVVAGLIQYLKQPSIIGYIITGLIVGPQFLDVIQSTETIDVFAQLGIALLLFIVGLSLSPKVVKEVGEISLVTGLGQIILTALIGYSIALALGYSPLVSGYIALALSFSSTIVILKLLSDKKDLHRLYGKIAAGYLLIQDLVAIFALIFISTQGDGHSLELIIDTVIKGALLTAVVCFVTIFVLPALSNHFAKSQEFLFLFSISWGLGLAILFQVLGFSIEIGALVAGISLATSPYSFEISSRLRPLRDFFIILFFILLGAELPLAKFSLLIPPAIVFSLYVIFAKPLIIMLLIGALGYNKKNGFKAGLASAQISEFSLVVVSLAAKVNHVDQEIVSLITLVGLITITVSTYLILYSDQLYQICQKWLDIFERPAQSTDVQESVPVNMILFGYDRVGNDFIKAFKRLDGHFLVIDYDPAIIARLEGEKVNCQYGDANDNEFLDDLGMEQLRLAVSTISDAATNLLIIDRIKSVRPRAIIIVKAESVEDASRLYEAGASYVMIPHYITGDHATDLIGRHGFDFSRFIKEKRKHLSYLEKRRDSEYHAKKAES